MFSAHCEWPVSSMACSRTADLCHLFSGFHAGRKSPPSRAADITVRGSPMMVRSLALPPRQRYVCSPRHPSWLSAHCPYRFAYRCRLSGPVRYDVRHGSAGLTSLSGEFFALVNDNGTARRESHAFQQLTTSGYQLTGQPFILLPGSSASDGQRR